MKRSVTTSPQATTLIDHVKELQKRLIITVGSLLVVGAIAYYFYGPILEFMRSPLGTPLYYTTPAGSFAFVMKICFMAALAVTIPVLVYNLIMFIRPAYEKSLPKRRVYGMTAASSLLALSGAAFAFFWIVPGSLHFFAGYQVSGLSALITADSYLNFVTSVIITFIIVFQLPMLISFIDKVKPLKPQKLFKMEKWVILGSLVIALVMPFAFDVTTSIFIAAPIIVLYNVSIVIVLAQHARDKRLESRANQLKKTASVVTPTNLRFETTSFNAFVPEIPQAVTARATQPVPVLTHQTQVKRKQMMDFAPRHSSVRHAAQPVTVVKPKPSVWVQPQAINATTSSQPRMRIISDIAPVRRQTI